MCDAKYHSVARAAAYAGCSRRFLQRRIAAGDLESYLVGRRRLVTFENVDRMMEAHRNRRARKGRGIHQKRRQREAANG